MNTKGMILSIVTAMLVMTMFASSAMASTITVDGQVSPSDEWDGDWSADDNPSGDPCDIEDHLMENWGYNMKTLYQHYDRSSNTLYFRLDVCGMPADLNGDNDVNGPCDPPHAPCDCDGVGSYEQYEIQLVSSGYTGVNMRYASNNVAHPDADAQWGTDCIEFSLINADTYVDPYDYCMFLSAGGIADPPYSEDLMDACYSDDPPVAKCSFTPISCGQGELSGTGSSDDVVTYAWDFYNDGTYDEYGETVSYDIVGTYDVRLMVTDDTGRTANCTISVTLTCGPIADAKADGSDGPVTLPSGGKMVTFCGDESYHPDYPDANITSYNWTILGVDYSTTDKDECFDVFVDETTTASLKVVDNFGCEHIDIVSLRMPPYKPPSDVPILTPTGMVALIGMLCIVGAGRILTKGRRL